VIDAENWADIRRLHRAEGLSIKAIARRLKIARHALTRCAPMSHRVANVPGVVRWSMRSSS
jgi:hypothetical protein